MASRHQNAHSRANSGSRTDAVTWVGGSCGRHGSYVFYKAFRFRLAPPEPSTPTSTGRSRTRRSLSTRSDEHQEEAAPEREPGHSSLTQERILSLGEFFFVQCRPEDPVCVGEIQLLWQDKHSGQDLASTRLYYLPETTPAGRTSQHGEDEMLAVSEKIVMRISDLASWIVEPQEWNYGSSLLITPPPQNGGSSAPSSSPLYRYSMLHSCVNMSDVNTEKKALLLSTANGLVNQPPSAVLSPDRTPPAPVPDPVTPGEAPSHPPCCTPKSHKAEVVMLGMNAYCRHKSILKRMSQTDRAWMARPGARAILAALGAVTSENPKARVVFCRDTFDYPQLFEHDLICEELAPVFKGRPRKKNKKGGALSAKGATKKVTNGAKSICRAADSPVDLVKHEPDASTPTRRSSGRRRSKRKSPQNLAYEDQYLPILARSSKRTRRTSARTPTPVSEAGGEKDASSLSPDLASSDAGRGYITAATVAQTIDVVAQSSAVDSLVGRKKGKGSKRARRRRSSATALDIAIKNSLLINHKPTSWSAEVESLASRKTPSGSANSSRSSSPSTELLLPGNQSSPKATSPAGSSASSAPPHAYASSSSAASSPVDFAPLTYSADEQDKPTRASSASPSPGADLLLHGLMDDRIPENKSTFLDKLYQFMRKRNTPIGRIPSLGFKKLDLWAFFKLSQEYGGYDMVTAKRLWKHVYDRMGGNPSCTSAATCTRKHFEKLLLPFEMHLRQQLRTKEPETREKRTGGSDDSVLGSANAEILSGKENTITQRTYNGDAYFINGAKTKLSSTTTSSILEDTNHSVTSQAKTNGFHDNVIKTSSASSVENLPTPLPAVARSLPSSVHQSAFVDFETLAHNVIRDELMTSRVSPVARNSPEDLSACRKPSGESPKLPVVRTSSNERSLLTRTPTVRVQSPVTLQPNVTTNMTSQLPIPTPLVSPLPLSAAQFSRASVIVGGSKKPPHPAPESRSSLMTSFRPLGSNRYAAAPPPFVPTKSKFTPTNAGNSPVVHHVDLTRPPHGVAASPEAKAIVIGQEKNDRLRLQKRPLDDAQTPATLRAVSPASPKRARADPAPQPLPQPLPKTVSPSGYRRHDIRNLFLNDSKQEENDVNRERKPFYVPPNFAARAQSAIKLEPMLGSSQYGRVPPGPRQPRPSFVDPRRLEESQRPVIVKPDARPRPVPAPVVAGGEPKRHLNGTSGLQLNRDGRVRPVSPPKHVELSREAPRKESYYRPCSMLSYRQQWQHKDNQQPPQPSANSKELHRPHIKPNEKHSPVITNGVSRPTELGEKTPNSLYSSRPRSPYEQRPTYKREQELQQHQQQQRKPFQSSFSVDRLTSDTRKNHHPYPATKSLVDTKPHIVHSAQESAHKQLPQLPPHGFLKAPDRKISQPSGPGHMESYKLDRHPEPPRRPEPPRQSDFVGFQAKPEPHKRQQATVAPMPAPHSSPAKDSSPLSATANAFLSSLPPAVASAMYPLIPKDCTPKMLDQILQEAMKSMGVSHMQHSNQLLHAEMQEALLRQQLDAAPFRIITHQEQQAAAASQLARVAMIGSQVAHPDPMTAQMYQAYQNLFLARHMQEAATAGSSAAAAAAAAQSLKLGQLANRDALLGLTPGRGAPPHLSVGVSTHLSPSVRNPAAAFPSQPPHYPADFGLPYTRR